MFGKAVLPLELAIKSKLTAAHFKIHKQSRCSTVNPFVGKFAFSLNNVLAMLASQELSKR